MSTEPVAPVPLTSAGASRADPLTAIGLRTSTCRPRQVSEPNRHSPTWAFRLVTVTSYVALSPGLSVSRLGLTVTENPFGASTETLYFCGPLSVETLVTVRCTVWVPGTDAIPISVSGADYLRIALPPDGVDNPNVDLDIYLFDPSGKQAASSTNGGTDEQIDLPDPANGTWTLYVHGWQTVTGNAAYRLYDWVVPNATGGSLTITSAPASATSGQTGTVTAGWTGAGDTWNLGSVSHENGTTKLGRTLVEVDNRP